MGTQQILMIILSVVIVGTAIAIGIQMFDTQLENNTRQTLAAELMTYASEAQSWYRLPFILGGGGNGWEKVGTTPLTANTVANSIGRYITRTSTPTGLYNNDAKFSNLHGDFTIVTSGSSATGFNCTITAVSSVKPDIVAKAEFPLAGNGSNIVITQLDAVP